MFRANEGTTLAKMLREHIRQLLQDIMVSDLLRARSFRLVSQGFDIKIWQHRVDAQLNVAGNGF